ncbi:uncharacterized protein N7511_001687 [Penicillium nucicola]|uniref:uncharacterized protein n=1 Tax=Penicillium nucicola TaxID=1850975 RepID=UPI002545B0DF|nr:uncharacterized protein N7511_001687 [Penicillium nucicola]KAJ5776676.1 hypothetical protein N7511_001687 [Penicillium nucicola]
MRDGQDIPGEFDNESHEPQIADDGPESSLIPVLPPRPKRKPSSRTVEETIAQGLSNEDLWMLLRRFDKQIYHVKAVHDVAALNLDLNRTENEQFPPEKLRMTLERFYTSVIVGVTEFIRHITRLRSWKEPLRTSLFCGGYFVAWAVDLLVPAILGLIVALIMVPPVRLVLFPGLAKKEGADKSKGNDSSPTQPQSQDSLTGAPENHKGEAAEQEARNLVDSFATVAMESAAAKYGQTVTEEEPDRPLITEGIEAAEAAAESPNGDAPEDKTKKPMKKKVSHATDQAMRVLSDITDVYEKFSKTLLVGVPTNAQLTLTLLRIGEINSTPLPPPPTPGDNDRVWPLRRKKSQPTSTELATQGSSTSLQSTNSDMSLPDAKPKKKTIFRILKFFRRTIAIAIKSHIAFDRAIAIAGSAHTKNLIDMLQNRHFAATPYGPLKFDAKYERKRGAAVIDSSKEPPILYFTTYQSSGLDDLRIESRKKGSVLFQIPVTEIKELKKTEGLGWKGKLIVELTAGSKEAADGLVIGGDELGQTYHLTGMRSRNQLFNRLVAIDAQFWESR